MPPHVPCLALWPDSSHPLPRRSQGRALPGQLLPQSGLWPTVAWGCRVAVQPTSQEKGCGRRAPLSVSLTGHCLTRRPQVNPQSLAALSYVRVRTPSEPGVKSSFPSECGGGGAGAGW